MSVSTVGMKPDLSEEQLQATIREELADWFGEKAGVQEWRHLRTYRIPFAQPSQV